jgi:hypothetical protein
MIRLQVHPEAGWHVECLAEKVGCGWRDATATSDDLVDPLDGDANVVREIGLRQTERSEKVVDQDLSRMDWITLHHADSVALAWLPVNPLLLTA